MAKEVWILESLRTDDRKTGKELQQAILKGESPLRHSITTNFYTPSSRTEFLSALDQILSSAGTGKLPILHIEAHGDEAGLQFSNDDIIDWADLSKPLIAINDQLKGNFVVTVAACSGAYLARTVLHSMRAPFFAVLGPGSTLTDSELIEDYAEFYSELNKTHSITKARWALNAYKTYNETYFFSTAPYMFAELYREKWSKKLSQNEINQSIKHLADRLCESSPELDVNKAKEVAKQVLSNSRRFVQNAWEIFMFIDKYPENRDLFEFPFSPEE